jgi:predicted dehydrogenase
MDATEAAEMARVAADNGILLAEAFRLRHQPIHHKAIELIRAGRIGDVVHVRNAMMMPRAVEQRRPELDWRFNKPAGGGVTYDIGCYCINQIRWAMGAEPETVQAFGRWGEVSGVDEHVVAIASFPGGRTAEWCVSWHAGPRHVAEVIGSAGTIRIENAWGDRDNTARQLEVVQRGHREVFDFEPLEQFGLQLAHMRDALEKGVPHRIPPSDSIAQMRVIDAVYASLRSGQLAHVGEPVAR